MTSIKVPSYGSTGHVVLLLLLRLIRCGTSSAMFATESVEKLLDARKHEPLPDSELEPAEWQLGRANLVSKSL